MTPAPVVEARGAVFLFGGCYSKLQARRLPVVHGTPRVWFSVLEPVPVTA